MRKQLMAIMEREGDGYVALCPEVDVASQGATTEEARDNLREALELFFSKQPRPRKSASGSMKKRTILVTDEISIYRRFRTE